ncbi:MAG TPA: alpha/beta hydrolase [Trebonia sp.]|nr:alpha/beta hydrolase [Trebonia sp.]
MAGSPFILGSGEHRVVAVHGWFGSAEGWGSLPQYLDGTAHTYAFMDLRGYGTRKSVPGKFTVEEAAGDVLAVADELGWDQFSVIGHSMGAKIGHRALHQAPSRVRRLIGISPVAAGATPMDEQTWQLFDGAARDPAYRAAIIDFTTGNKLTKTFIDQVVRHSLESSDVEAFGAYLRMWAKEDFSADVVSSGLGVPVKVIVGETDPAVSAEVARQTWLVYFPGAELEVMANAGHYTMFETPVALATSIERFLDAE